jgi:hypothetical protein
VKKALKEELKTEKQEFIEAQHRDEFCKRMMKEISENGMEYRHGMIEWVLRKSDYASWVRKAEDKDQYIREGEIEDWIE